jgi:hypothetical protein
MLNWLNRLLCDSAGIPDEARVGTMMLILTYCGAAITTVIMSPAHTFDLQAFGIGATGLAGGIGLLFKLRGSQ